MQLCSHEYTSPHISCESVEEIYKRFASYILERDLWLAGSYSATTDTNESIKDQIKVDRNNFEEIKKLYQELGSRAHKVCIVHNNPDNLDLNRSLKQIYRPDQSQRAIDGIKATKTDVFVPVTQPFDHQELNMALSCNTPPSTTPTVDLKRTTQKQVA